MASINLDKRIIDMTANEFAEVLAYALSRSLSSDSEKVESQSKRLVYGIAGIAQLFNCSTTTANRIKASGKIDRAISQVGRVIIVDADLALELIQAEK